MSREQVAQVEDQGPWLPDDDRGDSRSVTMAARTHTMVGRLAGWWRRLVRGQTDAGLWLHPPPTGPVMFDPSLQTAADLTTTRSATTSLPPPPKAA
jgi:hypothetical protein